MHHECIVRILQDVRSALVHEMAAPGMCRRRESTLPSCLRHQQHKAVLTCSCIAANPYSGVITVPAVPATVASSALRSLYQRDAVNSPTQAFPPLLRHQFWTCIRQWAPESAAFQVLARWDVQTSGRSAWLRNANRITTQGRNSSHRHR